MLTAQADVRIASKIGIVPSADTAKHTVKAVAKAVEVLRAFGPGRPEMTITDVTVHTGLDRGTAFRLIHTLIELGYLAAIPGARRFRLTLKCLELGFNALASGGLKAQSGPLLRELVPSAAEAASLGVLNKADVVYVERVQVDMGRHDLDRRVGSRTGAYATALGHAILAWKPPEPVLAANGRGTAGVSLTVRRETAAVDAFVARALPPLTRVVESLSRASTMLAAA